MNRRLLALVACLLTAAGVRAAALDVVQQRWGFDGQAAPCRINLLSIEVANRSPEPFDGLLELVRTGGVGGRTDAPLVEPCFLSPGASRWVQFYPYVRGEHEEFALEWGFVVKSRYEVKPPSLGPPARVLLQDPDELATLARKLHFPVLPDGLFPPTVAATDGLHSVLLDHVPRWEPVRKQAFLDWVRAGGEVHILLDRAGRRPAFADELSVLNSPLNVARLGSGLVVRHGLKSQEATPDVLKARGYPAPTLKVQESPAFYYLDEALLTALADLTRPRHSWGLIYLTIIVYIAVVGPVNYIVGIRRRDYRVALLLFFASVAGCALLLGFLGARGQGEATAVHTLATARQIDPDRYDVTQWGNVFVTRGATYDITHASSHNVYAACRYAEVVPGQIRNGRGGVFRVEIPLFSHRAFLHRAELRGHHIKFRVAEWAGGQTLQRLVLEPEAGFPDEVVEMWARYRTDWHRLEWSGGRIALAQKLPSDDNGFFGQVGGDLDGPFRSRSEDEARELPPDQLLRRFVRMLIAREVGGTGSFLHDIVNPPLGGDRVQLFLFARSPESFDIQGGRLGRRVGYTLYRIDLFKPEAPDG